VAGQRPGDPLTNADSPPHNLTSPEELDAWSARLARDPFGNEPVDLICIGDGDSCEKSTAVEVIRRKGRLGHVIAVSVPASNGSLGESLAAAFEQVRSPLFVLTDAQAEWNRDIFERLLAAVDACDIALGARHCPSFATRLLRWAACFGRGLFWGAGVLDPLTPYKLGRSSLLQKFPLQSAGRFVDVELIAKANFLDALIDEVALPVASPWKPPRFGPESRADRRQLFRKPQFRHTVGESVLATDAPSEPAADPQESFNPQGEVSPGPHADVRTHGIDGSVDA